MSEVQNELQGDSSNSLRAMLNYAFGSPQGSLKDFAGYVYDQIAPSVPTNLTGSGSIDGTGSFTLDWNASSDTGSGVDHYKIYKDSTDLGKSITGTSYTGFQSVGTTSTYRVSAVDNAGNESGKTGGVVITTEDFG